MAKDEKKPRGRPKGSRESVAFQVRIPPEMHKALMRAAERSDRTRNAEALVAIRKHLIEIGEWPPAKGGK